MGAPARWSVSAPAPARAGSIGRPRRLRRRKAPRERVPPSGVRSPRTSPIALRAPVPSQSRRLLHWLPCGVARDRSSSLRVLLGSVPLRLRRRVPRSPPCRPSPAGASRERLRCAPSVGCRREAKGEGVPDASWGARSSSRIVGAGTIDLGHVIRRPRPRPVSAAGSPSPARRPLRSAHSPFSARFVPVPRRFAPLTPGASHRPTLPFGFPRDRPAPMSVSRRAVVSGLP